MVSQVRIYLLSVKILVSLAVVLSSSQSMAESRSEILERIRPIGRVNIESQAVPEVAAQPQPLSDAPAVPTDQVAEAESAPVTAATQPSPDTPASPAPMEPIAKAEPAPVAAAPPPQLSASDGAALYAAKGCPACHGADGERTTISTYPKLAGQSPEYAYNQMKDIKSGARSSGQAIVMKGIIANVSDDEMRIIADWLGGL